MVVTSFYRQMADFAQWKRTLSRQLRDCQSWFTEYRFHSPAALHCLQQASKLLDNDSFTIACVGEFSRGKTELINALLFTEYDQRLLPSKPGRTTMCPTEIYYDANDEPGQVRLLPIETRRTTTSLNNFKRIPQNWIKLRFDINDPDSVAHAMNKISEVKQVDASDARAMGFDPQQLSSNSDGLLEVPKWRHALINLDHPLLRQGLRILDTPGLNALGNEPELTLSCLQQADALVFLLSADAGLSYSDATIWQDHLQGLRCQEGTLTVLNKIDTLWDDLCPPQQIQTAIDDMRQHTARLLGLSRDQVLAISAKQGLLARARNDQTLLQRSNLPQLELMLARQLAHNQQRIACQPLLNDAVDMLRATRQTLKQQLLQSDKELLSLQQRQHQPQQFEAMLKSLRSQVRQRHQRYHRYHLDLRGYQHQINQHAQLLQAPLAPVQLEGLISTTHQSMVKSWSFVGLNKAMDEFFNELKQRFERLASAVELANADLHTIYLRAHQLGGTNSAAVSHALQLHPHRQRLQQLELQAQQFRRSLGNIFNLKQRVIGRFINSLVQEVRLMNLDLQAAIDDWGKSALAPLSHATEYQKSLLDQQMLRITHLKQYQQNQQQRLPQLQRLIAEQKTALIELDRIIARVPVAPAASRPIEADSVALA